MTKDLIRYDLQVQDALRGVVRKVIGDVAREGLPGDHHFYISFRTGAQGVRLSQRLREKYPEEMTIVLQHQFWDLGVTEYSFEVGLSFSGIPERLLIPFDALTGFFDPSVQFGLKFELADPTAGGAAQGTAAPSGMQDGAKPGLPAPRRGAVPAIVPAKARVAETRDKDEPVVEAVEAPKKSRRNDKAAAKDATDAAQAVDSATVVSLDAFRKKGEPRN